MNTPAETCSAIACLSAVSPVVTTPAGQRRRAAMFCWDLMLHQPTGKSHHDSKCNGTKTNFCKFRKVVLEYFDYLNFCYRFFGGVG